MLAAKKYDDGAELVLAARFRDCGAFGCGATLDGFRGTLCDTFDGGAALFYMETCWLGCVTSQHIVCRIPEVSFDLDFWMDAKIR